VDEVARRSRAVTVAAVVAAALALAGVAWAASLTVTSKSLGGATLTTPAFYPSSLTIVNRGTAGRVDRNDTLTLVYNRVIQNSSLCAGVPQGTLTAAGLTFTLSNGGAGNDVLAIAGGSSCAALHFGSFLLGSTGYLASGSLTYTASGISVTATATTTTIVLTVGTGTASSAVNTASVVKYTPDPLMTDIASRSIGTNTATTASGVQF
jgi:hypothetical protein